MPPNFHHDQITVQRTELNSPLGLEVQLHITEAVCPALSEPGKQWKCFQISLVKWHLHYGFDIT